MPVLGGLFSLSFLWLAEAAAHPVDQYLQASYLALSAGEIKLEMDLTPGDLVRDQVLARIDSDGDGRISDAEADVYANALARQLTLDVDGERRAWNVDKWEISGLTGRDPDGGPGRVVIRMEMNASAPVTAGQEHRLHFQNEHATEIGAYMVTAFYREKAQVKVLEQRRDPLQRSLDLTYRIEGPPPAPASPSTPAPLPMSSRIAFVALGLLSLAGFAWRAHRDQQQRSSG